MHQRKILFDSLPQIGHDILKLNESLLIDTLSFGNPIYNALINSEILMTCISYIFARHLMLPLTVYDR